MIKIWLVRKQCTLFHLHCVIMASFKDTRDFLLLYDTNFLTNDDFFLLFDMYSLPNLDLPYDSFPTFCMTTNVWHNFALKKAAILILVEVLQTPPVIRSNQGSVCNGMEALCMLLNHLYYPRQYSNMVSLFANLCQLSA